MARPVLRATVGAVLLSIVPLLLAAGPDEPRSSDNLDVGLAVQAALDQGQQQLQRGNYQAAVYALERELFHVNAHFRKEYMQALADAYRGYIRELQQKHLDKEAELYVTRLSKLDPGASLEHRQPQALATLATQATPPAPAAPVKQPEVRAAMDYKAAAVAESDPFSNANRAPRDARAVLLRADQEFNEKHYQVALRLYQEAHGIDPNATAACKKCWGYCRMATVLETLKQSSLTPAAKEDLKQEVHQAMEMAAPNLDDYGKSLLSYLEGRPESSKNFIAADIDQDVKFEMRDLGTQGHWHVLETPHFRIIHNQPAEVAEKAAKIVEKTRLAMSKKWFGDAGEAWTTRCDVYLHATGEDYARSTGKPANSPGHSTIRAEGERVLSRCIDLHCDDPNWPIGVLPHETTHVVLAGRYGAHAVPRWADEGMAVLAEPRDRIERHLRNLPRHRDDKVLFNVGKLMELNDYPQPQYIGPFYAQSVSLVEYLSSLKGPQEYTAFLRDGLRAGYEGSLQKHYNIQGYADLQRRWEAAAFQSATTAEAMR